MRSIQQSNPSESHLRKAYAFLVSHRASLVVAKKLLIRAEGVGCFFQTTPRLRFREAGLLHEAGHCKKPLERTVTY